jgi:hypothetical protein
MASRQEEKERRRQERIAAEQAAQKSQQGRKRAALVAGGLLAAAVLVLVGIFALGGSEDTGTGSAAAAQAPPRDIRDLDEATRAAGCELSQHDIEGRDHVPPETRVNYRTNPPSSGNHTVVAAQDGIYAPGNPPDLKQSVHALEHGRINIQYRTGTPVQRINQLEAMFNEEVAGVPGYRTLLFENQSGMDAAVAAAAWGYTLVCDQFNDRVFDALRAFREERQGQGPEQVP